MGNWASGPSVGAGAHPNYVAPVNFYDFQHYRPGMGFGGHAHPNTQYIQGQIAFR
jgi:hypothetical protein